MARTFLEIRQYQIEAPVRRREDAEKREAARAKRTTKQQLALLKKRPGESIKEVDRLLNTG